MRRTRTGVLGSLLLIAAAATGCGTAHPRTAASSAAAAGPTASAPDAPRWCAEVSGARSIPALPRALGRLTVDPWDFSAHDDVAAARSDLGDLLATLRAGHAPTPATAALKDLVATLDTVVDTGPSAHAAERIRTDLTSLGQALQPVCEFPT